MVVVIFLGVGALDGSTQIMQEVCAGGSTCSCPAGLRQTQYVIWLSIALNKKPTVFFPI